MLKISNLRKEYDNVVAVDGVSLEVKRGELFGLLGPNGAGKTTTIRTVLNIIQPDSGEIRFDGKPFTQEMWNSIGYLPEERGLYRKSKIINTILYFASLKGLAAKQAKPLAFYWLERFGLKNEGHRKIEELSKGNQQKVQLILSILHRPELLILDEPFTGLDPVNQVLLKDVLLELRQQNTAIVFSTHQMEQVEKMCDNICLINKGKPVLSGELFEIKKQYGTNSIHLEYEGDGEFLKSFSFIRRADVYQNYAELELTDISKSSELLVSLNGKLSLRKFEIVEPSLNSIFINVVGGPEKIEQASEKPIPVSQIQQKSTDALVMKEGRVRKALFSLIGMAILTLAFTMFALSQIHPQLMTVGILSAVTILSAVRFFQTKKKVKQEFISKASPKERL
ncbi:MAG: ATP-binding cassette domain-containing protein [Ignavibacteriales bacterium]|nr:ATP-binding cassette domain-containing protein [Ignavibacteriales bacterium]